MSNYEYETRPPNPTPRYSWAEVWSAVLTRPSIATFHEILRDPGATYQRALLWMGIVGAIAVTLSLLFLAPEMGFEVSGMALLITIPIVGVMVAFVFAGFMGITHFVAQTLGGKGSYNHLLYASAAYTAPIAFIDTALLAIAFVSPDLLSLIQFFLRIYTVYITMLSLRAIYGFDWGRAFLAFLLPGIAIIMLAILLLGGSIPQAL